MLPPPFTRTLMSTSANLFLPKIWIGSSNYQHSVLWRLDYVKMSKNLHTLNLRDCGSISSKGLPLTRICPLPFLQYATAVAVFWKQDKRNDLMHIRKHSRFEPILHSEPFGAYKPCDQTPGRTEEVLSVASRQTFWRDDGLSVKDPEISDILITRTSYQSGSRKVRWTESENCWISQSTCTAGSTPAFRDCEMKE